MTPHDLQRARFTLGDLWNLNRPVSLSEMGRVLRLRGNDVGAAVRAMERGRDEISGPISACVAMMLQGALPPDGLPPA